MSKYHLLCLWQTATNKQTTTLATWFTSFLSRNVDRGHVLLGKALYFFWVIAFQIGMLQFVFLHSTRSVIFFFLKNKIKDLLYLYRVPLHRVVICRSICLLVSPNMVKWCTGERCVCTCRRLLTPKKEVDIRETLKYSNSVKVMAYFLFFLQSHTQLVKKNISLISFRKINTCKNKYNQIAADLTLKSKRRT